MSGYKVVLARGVEAELAAVSSASRPAVHTAIMGLAQNPYPSGKRNRSEVISILNTDVVGYRVEYMVQDHKRSIVISSVSPLPGHPQAPVQGSNRQQEILSQIAEWLRPAFQDMHTNNAGELIIPFGPTAVLIDVTPLHSGLHRLYLTCPVIVGVPPSAELAAFVGWKAGNFLFGSLGLRQEDDSQHPPLTVEFEHSVHFEGTAAAPMTELVAMIAQAGLELMDELLYRFGGERPA
jgi:mRNA-degrading endonuclease RelE of RelBE toxin-antitoxin system